jgi:predicted negative regulator of RcsB-dependent stress response
MVLPEEHRADPASLDAATLQQLNAPYEALGLKILWMRDHDELPDLLDEIRTEPPERAVRLAAEGMMRRAEAANEAGDLEGEIEGLERAMAYGGTLGTRAAYNLALLRLTHGSPESGVPLLRTAMESRDREWSALAGAVLGDFLAQSGQTADARLAYEHCLMTGHEPALATARAGLDRLARGPER